MVVPRILKLLEDSNPEVRAEAARTVSGLPSRAYCGFSKEEPELIEKVIPRLVELLEDKDPRVQRSAGFSLLAAAHWYLENKEKNETPLNIFSKLAEHSDVRNRKDAAYFWIRHAKEFPEAAKEMMPLLIKLAKDPDKEICHYAELALKSLAKEV